VFGWVLRQVTRAGLLKGKTIGIDATTLEANAAMKSIVRPAETAREAFLWAEAPRYLLRDRDQS
jgi:hypothetical protein